MTALLAASIGACNPGNAELPATTGTESECKASESHHAPARLLTRSEYDNAVRDLLGDDTAPGTHSFPPEPEVEGFNNDAASLLANPLLVEKLAEAARDVSERAVERGLGELAPCAEGEAPKTCARAFLGSFGKRAFRRPLLEAEVTSFLGLFQKAQPSLGYDQAIGLVLEAMLQSPQFLYRGEAPLVDAVSAGAEKVALGPYELASRLSFFLWGSVPDEELLAAADKGQLSTEAEVAEQARRLLADERARGRVREFHAQWLGLGRFETVVRNEADDATRDSWKGSILAFLDDVFWREGGTVSDLYSSENVFVDERLAELYGVNADVSGSEFVPVTLDPHRSGLLTQPGLMAMLAHPGQSSPIQRGVFVREKILCAKVPAPPPSVNNNPPDPDPSLTTRERFAVHTEDADCATCHRMIDPLGFGFEAFDQLGRFRATEGDKPVDTSGALVAAPDKSLDGEFDGAGELSARLASSELVLECLTRNWYRFALGRGDDDQDECIIQNTASQSAALGGNLEELLVAMTQSQSFRYRAPWPEETP